MCRFMHVHVCTCVYIIFMHIHIRIHLRIQTHILIHSLNPEPELISDFPGPYIRFGGHGIGLRTQKYGVLCGTCCRAASESKAKQRMCPEETQLTRVLHLQTWSGLGFRV